MVHLIVLKNKSAELVVSLDRKRKMDHFKPAKKSELLLVQTGKHETVFFCCSYEVSFL